MQAICNPGSVTVTWRIAAYPLAVVWAWAMSAVIVAIPTLIGWATATGEQPFQPMMRAADLWALAMAPPVTLNGLPISLMPWGFTLIWLALFWVGMRWAMSFAPDIPSRVLTMFVAGAVVLTGAFAAIITRATSPELDMSAWTVALHAAFIAALGMIVGAEPAYRAWLGEYLPEIVKRGTRAAVLAVLLLLAGAAALLFLSVATRIGDISAIWSELQPTATGGLLLFLLQIGYVPVLIVWSAAYMTGAGIVIGEQATISPFIATTSAVDLPPLPILAALPTTASPLMWLLPILVIAIGAWSTRRALRGSSAQRLDQLAVAGISAALTAVIMAGLAAISSGSLGAERLAVVGPTPVVIAWLTFGLLAIGGALAVVVGTQPRAAAPPIELDAAEEQHA